MELLTFDELCQVMNVSKSTMAEWIKDFDVYIPKIEMKHILYYHPEMTDVLRLIKNSKSKGYSNSQIKDMLAGQHVSIQATSEEIEIHTLKQIQHEQSKKIQILEEQIDYLKSAIDAIKTAERL